MKSAWYSLNIELSFHLTWFACFFKFPLVDSIRIATGNHNNDCSVWSYWNWVLNFYVYLRTLCVAWSNSPPIYISYFIRLKVMDKGWTNLPRYSNEYMHGVESFLDFAFSKGRPQGEEILCPCAKCNNSSWERRDIVFNHLIRISERLYCVG